FEETADVLALIHDEESAKDIVPRLKKLKKKLEKVMDRDSKIMLTVTKEDKESIKTLITDAMPTIKETGVRLGKELARVQRIAQMGSGSQKNLDEAIREVTGMQQTVLSAAQQSQQMGPPGGGGRPGPGGPGGMPGPGGPGGPGPGGPGPGGPGG